MKGVLAHWKTKQKEYFVCSNKEKIKNKYPKAKVLVLDEFLDHIMEHNHKILVSIRDGKTIQDPLKMLAIIQKNIERGRFIGTKEKIMKKFSYVSSHLQTISEQKYHIFESIYISTVEVGQAALLLNGSCIPVQKKLPEELRKAFVKSKVLEKSHVLGVKDIIKTFKDYEHNKRMLPSGRELDSLKDKAQIFRDAVMKKIVKASN